MRGHRCWEFYFIVVLSSAELDELMTSLNNFKMAERQVDEPVIHPNLDTMLGNLQVLVVS